LKIYDIFRNILESFGSRPLPPHTPTMQALQALLLVVGAAAQYPNRFGAPPPPPPSANAGCALIIPGPGKSALFDQANQIFGGRPNTYDGQNTCITFEVGCFFNRLIN